MKTISYYPIVLTETLLRLGKVQIWVLRLSERQDFCSLAVEVPLQQL